MKAPVDGRLICRALALRKLGKTQEAIANLASRRAQSAPFCVSRDTAGSFRKVNP